MQYVEDFNTLINEEGFHTQKPVSFEGAFLNKGGGDFDVKYFGAKGDGVTDDSDAIDAAIAAIGYTGATLFFPPGVYSVSRPIIFDTVALAYSVAAPSIIGAPGRSGPSIDFVDPDEIDTEWPLASAVTIRAADNFPTGEYIIDWRGSTVQDRSICGYRMSGFVLDCNGRGAGMRNFNPFAASFADIVIDRSPTTPDPTYVAAGDNTGAFEICADPTQNSFFNTLERLYVRSAPLDGIHLNSGSGSYDLVNMCDVNNSGRFGYNIEDKAHVFNSIAQSNANVKGQDGADWRLGRYNVKMFGCASFSGKPKYGNGIKVAGGGSSLQQVIGGTFYGAENPQQDIAENVSAVVQLTGALQNIEFVGVHFLTGNSTFTSDFVYTSVNMSGHASFTGCQFLTEQGSALTNVPVNFNGKQDLLSFSNCKGINPAGTKAKGNITGAVTFDRKDGCLQTGTLTGNITVTLAAGIAMDDILTLKLTQDGTGNRTVTWPSNFKKAGGTLTLSTSAAAVDIISAKWDGTNWIEVSRSLNVS